MTELLWKPALELAELVRTGEVSARELVQESLDRIDAIDPTLNAFTVLDGERALEAADAIEPGDERPFAGVPIALKDLAAPYQGLPLSQGSDLFQDFDPPYDAFVVRRLREAGFLIVGRTSTPEFGILPVTEPRRFGPTRNPWDPDRTPGGSSGGSGAAVASGMVPIAHGSDGGGSIRIPAACCGLVGLKASRGRISRGPELGDHYLATDGVLARTVADSAAALDLLAGYEPGDATWAPDPPEPFAATAAREPGKLRIALVLDPPIQAEVDPVYVQAARDAAELLSSLGHEIEETDGPWPGDTLLQGFTDVWAAQISTGVGFGGLVAGREPTADDVEPLTWELFQRARGVDSTRYLLTWVGLEATARAIVTWCSAYDVILTPALAQRPVPIGEIDPCGPDPWEAFAKAAAFTPYTAIANVTGQPAISVPLFHGDDGLPTAVHLVGRPLAEGTLLSLAGQLEAARPWIDRQPALAAL